MSIEVNEITAYQRNQILQIKEGHFSDIKARDIKPSKLTRTLSAFANADGGELYISIDEEKIDRKKTRKWRGFLDQESANGHVQAFEAFFPLGQYFTYSFLFCKHSSGLILKIEVYKTRNIQKASDGTIYLRRGAQNLPIKTEEQLHRLKLSKESHPMRLKQYLLV